MGTIFENFTTVRSRDSNTNRDVEDEYGILPLSSDTELRNYVRNQTKVFRQRADTLHSLFAPLRVRVPRPLVHSNATQQAIGRCIVVTRNRERSVQLLAQCCSNRICQQWIK
jgi:hypothetical protein